jgi:hypothetical protein
LNIEVGEQGIDKNIQQLHKAGPLVVALLDQMEKQVFYPIPFVALDNCPVWKSCNGWYYFHHSKPDEDGWYLTQELFTALDKVTNKELLLAT